VIDLALVEAQYRSLSTLLPAAEIYYAIKANPAPAVIATLDRPGARFDIASMGETERCLRLGVNAARMSFGNTIKREADIVAASRTGVDLFAFGCEAELPKVSRDRRPADPAMQSDPTCEITDILYERTPVALPLDLTAGDTLDFLSAGAYTASHASVEFKGFAPLAMHCI
jgi:diaminopimelate decarboxylase